MKNSTNINMSECIKEKNNIGSTLYTNVCTGETYTIRWSSFDWFAFDFSVLCIITLIVTIGMLIKEIKKSRW